MVTKIIHTIDEESVKELDGLYEELISIPAYQAELMESVNEVALAQIVTMSGLKISQNTVRAMIARKDAVYQKAAASKGQDIFLQTIKAIFSSSITLSELASTLVISVPLPFPSRSC